MTYLLGVSLFVHAYTKIKREFIFSDRNFRGLPTTFCGLLLYHNVLSSHLSSTMESAEGGHKRGRPTIASFLRIYIEDLTRRNSTTDTQQ